MTEAERTAVQLDDSIAWSRLALVQAHAKAEKLGRKDLVHLIEEVQLRLSHIHVETGEIVDDPPLGVVSTVRGDRFVRLS